MADAESSSEPFSSERSNESAETSSDISFNLPPIPSSSLQIKSAKVISAVSFADMNESVVDITTELNKLQCTPSTSEAQYDTRNGDLDASSDVKESQDASIKQLETKVQTSDNDGSAIQKTSVKEAQAEAPPKRPKPSACIFVASLCAEMSDESLSTSIRGHFSKWGEVSFVKVLRDKQGRPYAFVQYETEESADKALSLAQDTILCDRRIRCEPAKVNRTLFITADGLDAATLRHAVEKFGSVDSIVPYHDLKSWFVKYTYREDAISAYGSLKAESHWRIVWAQNLEQKPREMMKRYDRKSIFVSNLDKIISKEDLLKRFSKHGDIIECHVLKYVPTPADTEDQDPIQGSCACITFENETSAENSIMKENGNKIGESEMKIGYKTLRPAPGSRKVRYYLHERNGVNIELAPPPVSLDFKSYDSKKIGPISQAGSQNEGKFGRGTEKQISVKIGKANHLPSKENREQSVSDNLTDFHAIGDWGTNNRDGHLDNRFNVRRNRLYAYPKRRHHGMMPQQYPLSQMDMMYMGYPGMFAMSQYPYFAPFYEPMEGSYPGP